jgi:hypothetical protein
MIKIVDSCHLLQVTPGHTAFQKVRGEVFGLTEIRKGISIKVIYKYAYTEGQSSRSMGIVNWFHFKFM